MAEHAQFDIVSAMRQVECDNSQLGSGGRTGGTRHGSGLSPLPLGGSGDPYITEGMKQHAETFGR